MMYLMVGALLHAIDAYDRSAGDFNSIMKRTLNLSRQLQGGKCWKNHYTHHVADTVGVDTNTGGAGISGGISPVDIDDRRDVLAHVRSLVFSALVAGAVF